MLEKKISGDAQISEDVANTPLASPFLRGFETLMYLKQRKDAGLTTNIENIKNKFERVDGTARGYLRELLHVGMIEKMLDKTYTINDKGERYLYDSILPIFSNQQKIVRKIFFRENLTHNDMVIQEKLKCLDCAFDNLMPDSLEWFRGWLVQEFGEYELFEEWFLEFEKQHVKFLEKQLEKEKKRIT